MELRNITKIARNMMLYKNSVNKNSDSLNETEFEMIRYICKRDKRSLIEVSSYLNVDKSLVTRMCKKLTKLGYIEIKNDPNDSRKKNIYATNKALSIKDKVANEEIDFYNACIKNLSKDEISQLDILIEKVYIESKKLRKNGFKGAIDEK